MAYDKTVVLADDLCAGCEGELPKGSEAIMDSETELIFCDRACADEFFETTLA